ncbi:hypothetical protein [Clostridium chromiireducens]|uniref:hypothetical protein n=1 Tax=Clostridium chromiireducens TaxID=225345 RepID=UPI001FAB25DB|nr:hypothetical protein [Clostridium chromiireducens]
MYDISNNFKWNVYDAAVAKKLLELEGTPEAIKYFAEKSEGLTNYGYWFFLSTLWVSYSGYSDLNLWKSLFGSDRPGKKKSLMKPSEVKAYDQLGWFVTAYRAHRKNESDWISYTLNKETAFRFAKERGADSIKEYKIKKRDITALFLRRSEDEIIVLDKGNVQFIREHIAVSEAISISPWNQDNGYICLPLKSNIPDPEHKDWKLVYCPSCGKECWESELARKILKNPNMKSACTMCSLRKGIKVRGENYDT